MLGDSLRRRRKSRKSQPSKAEKKPGKARKGKNSGKSALRGALSALVSRRLLMRGGLGALVAFVLGYGVATRIIFPAPPPPRGLLEVPDLRGLAEAEAQRLVAEQGFALAAQGRYRHPTVPEGEILGQSPLPGQLANPGDTLGVTLSLGAERRPVPDVLRLREDWAQNVLEASGFTVTRDTLQAELPEGRVVEVIPEPGTEVALPMEVQILVSTGPAQIRMPLLLGLERGAAEALVDSLGLVLDEVSTRFRFGRDQGRVVEQSPPADSLLDRGAGVRIVVGRRARGNDR